MQSCYPKNVSVAAKQAQLGIGFRLIKASR